MGFFFFWICRCTKSASLWIQEQICHQWGTISTHWNTNSLLIDMTTKFHIDVINTKCNHSNNISLWIFIWRVIFIFNQICSVVLYDYILVSSWATFTNESTSYYPMSCILPEKPDFYEPLILNATRVRAPEKHSMWLNTLFKNHCDWCVWLTIN